MGPRFWFGVGGFRNRILVGRVAQERAIRYAEAVTTPPSSLPAATARSAPADRRNPDRFHAPGGAQIAFRKSPAQHACACRSDFRCGDGIVRRIAKRNCLLCAHVVQAFQRSFENIRMRLGALGIIRRRLLLYQVLNVCDAFVDGDLVSLGLRRKRDPLAIVFHPSSQRSCCVHYQPWCGACQCANCLIDYGSNLIFW